MPGSPVLGAAAHAPGRFRVTADPLDPGETAGRVSVAECGAVATFIGLVRDHNAGRRVLSLEYECYEPLALRAFERIAAEAAEQWPTAHLAIAHRTGLLRIGEASVVIVGDAAAWLDDLRAAGLGEVETVPGIPHLG